MLTYKLIYINMYKKLINFTMLNRISFYLRNKILFIFLYII